MKSPYDLIRALISALVACLNSDGAAAKAKAQIEIDDLKSQLAGSQSKLATDNATIAAQGIPLTADETQHALDVLAQVNAAPAIPVPAQPVAPLTPDPALVNPPAPVAPPIESAPPKTDLFGNPVAPAVPPVANPDFKVGDSVTVIKSFFDTAKVGDTGTITEVEADGKYTVQIGVNSVVLPGDCLSLQ